MRVPRSTLPAAAILLIATTAEAQLTLDSCVLLPVTPGALGVSADGTQLASSGIGGIRATMNVTTTGRRPVITVAAPALSGPGASLSGATTMVAYSSLSGAAQPFTTGPSTFSPTALTDVMTFDARSTNAQGFRAGSYTLSVTVTCQQ